MDSNWELASPVPGETIGELGFPPMQSQLLYNRGLTRRQDALSFLSPGRSDLHDPMLLPDMGAAVARIRQAVAAGETVGVFGDFDIDGISGTAIVVKGLRSLGARVIPYIPDRDDEGHGLNVAAVRSLSDRGVSLLVTVDCGATSDAEAAVASDLGMDTIITDHHTMFEEAPYPVVAMINPKRPDSDYPFEHLTGAGVAFKLVQALYAETGSDEPEELMGLAALGTIGDVGPLVSENRYFVTEGLRRLNGFQSPGMRALVSVAKLRDKELDAGALSFQIIPRLNSPGRLGDADISLELLMTEDSGRASLAAAQLDDYNARRKLMTDAGLLQATAQVRKRWADDPPGLIMVGHRDWLPGILGLIAARLAETYGRPVVAVSIGDEVSRASARSVAGFNVFDAINRCSDLLVRFGGHDQAAGFTVPSHQLGALAKRFESFQIDEGTAHPQIRVDLEASPSVVQKDLFDFGLKLAPFGEGNPEPIYAANMVRVVESRAVGADGRHLKMSVDDGLAAWDAIGFRMGDRIGEAGVNSWLRIVYRMEPNTWRGRTTMQLVIQDFGKA